MDFQVFLLALMPVFYASFIVCGVFGLKFGIFHNYYVSLGAMFATYVLGNSAPFFFSGLSAIVFKGCLFSAVIGIAVGHTVRWLIVQLLKIV